MKLPRAPVKELAALLLAMALLGCKGVKEPDASGKAKQSFLFASVAEQTLTGQKDCVRYADGLSAKLNRSPYRYDLQRLYYCSIGAECHVVLRVNTGDAQFAADNGAFIEDHVETLAEFERRMTQHGSWRQVGAKDARLLMMAERYGHPS